MAHMFSAQALQRRIPYLDIMRVIACLMVLLVHAPQVRYGEYYHTPHAGYPFYITLITVSSKLFFLLSGALLLPVTRPAREFVTRRLRVVLIPLAVWSLVYLAEDWLTGDFSVKRVLSMWYHPVEGALWFVYVMVLIYITMPLITTIVKAIGKRGVELLLVLWAASSFIPYMHGMFLEFDQSSHNALSTFASPFGYVLLGYYLHNWPLPIFTRKHWWKFALAFAFGIVGMPVFEFVVQSHFGITYQQHIDTVTNDVSINDVMMATLLFSVVKHFTPASYNAQRGTALPMLATRLSVCTFGIYLGHMLVLRNIVWPLSRPYLADLPVLADGAICALLALVVTYAISRLIYCLPFSKYIIGH